MQVDFFKDKVKKFDDRVMLAEQKEQQIDQDIAALDKKIRGYIEQNDTLTKSIAIFNQAATVSRDTARKHFEQIVTNALQFITQSKDYEFIIQELTGRQKASYEFYIRSTVNGVECIQKPEDANGGGFVDIISTAAKYAYLEIFNDPKIMSGTLLYDEPAKMVSEQMSGKFAEYVKFLGTQYGRQTIMITHNEHLANIADRTFNVHKDNNGISHAEDYQKYKTALSQVHFKDFLDKLIGKEVEYDGE